ncbi:MAG: sulfatase-like hydrolase/transferase [Opitutaceae bacterium]|nr:sulfatase-like hydrolase/transferase [Opitutaceae bacterium]
MKLPYQSSNRSRSLFASLTIVTAILILASRSLAADKPNILYIYTDDQSDRTVSSYERSQPWVDTPNIDRLASSGVRFKHAYNGTWCMPARATFLTGKLQYGVQSMRMEGDYPGSEYDPKKAPFWMSSFKKAGYTTAHIGKWHTGTDTGYGRDWDHQIVWNRPKFPENSGNYYDNQLISFNGSEAKMTKGYSTDNYTRWATNYIEGQGRDGKKPWLLWLCFAGTHGPFTPADRHEGTIDPKVNIPLPTDIFGHRPGKPQYVKKRQAWKRASDGKLYTNRPPKGGEFFESSRRYQETAMSLDESVGILVETLKASGQFDNTLIVFTSDQGFAWGQHGFQHKIAPYDANISCPLIISFPGRITEGQVCKTPVGGQDLVPTLFNFAGVAMPWKMHGRDITPLLNNPEAESDHTVLMAYTARSYGADTNTLPSTEDGNSEIPWWVSYRKNNYKYIVNLIPDEIDELYDVNADSDEMTNLAFYPEYQQTVAQLRQELLAELRRTDCPFVDQIPVRPFAQNW